MKFKFLKYLVLVLTVFISACGNIARYDCNFCGRIIDKESNKPIPGVVIIADWENVSLGLAGGVHTVYKVAEVRTNDAGEFCLKGRGLVFFVEEPSIEIFKAGYSNIAESYLPNLKESYKYGNSEISWDGNKATIRLKKLSIEDRYKRGQSVLNYDTEINQGILSDSIKTGKFNEMVMSGRKLFDLEIQKERADIEEYRDKLEQEEQNARFLQMRRKPPSDTPPHVYPSKPE